MLNIKTLALSTALVATAVAAPLISTAVHAGASGVITAQEYSDVVVVDGSGLPAYDVVDIKFQAPDGERFDAGTVTANGRGQFELSVPTYEFLQIGTGDWLVAAGDSYGQGTAFDLFIS
jgi:hypothetical protein